MKSHLFRWLFTCSPEVRSPERERTILSSDNLQNTNLMVRFITPPYKIPQNSVYITITFRILTLYLLEHPEHQNIFCSSVLFELRASNVPISNGLLGVSNQPSFQAHIRAKTIKTKKEEKWLDNNCQVKSRLSNWHWQLTLLLFWSFDLDVYNFSQGFPAVPANHCKNYSQHLVGALALYIGP